MKNSPNNWKSLLNRWISGEADRYDERSLEALAQEDPFLADALEGYRSLPENDHARSVTKVNARLRKQYEQKGRGAGFYLLRVAAVGVFVLAAWLVLQQFGATEKQAVADRAEINAAEDFTAENKILEESEITKREQSQEPLNEEGAEKITSEESQDAASDATYFNYKNNVSPPNVSPAAPPAVKITPPPGIDAEQNAKYKARVLAEAAAKKRLSVEKKKVSEEAKMKLTEQEMAARKQEAVERLEGFQKKKETEALVIEESRPNEPPPAVSNEADIADDVIPAAPKPMEDAIVTMDKDAVAPTQKETIELTLRGQVTDGKNDPLIGASIMVEGTTYATITDLEGYFSLQSPLKEPNLLVSYTGYETQHVQVMDDRFLNVQLSEGVTIDEVVVSARRNKRVKTETASSSVMIAEDATPKGGLNKFKKYIRKNLQMPQAAIDAGVKGIVTLGFKIDENGKPIDIKVFRSIGYGCDEEAIRLLEDGPDWVGATGGGNTYEFEFK